MTARQIASRLAENLMTRTWVPDGIDTPLVYLDGMTQTIEMGKHPTLIVVPKLSLGLWKSNPEHSVEVVLAIDSSAFVSNAAAQTTTPEGVMVFGAGGTLEAVAEALVNIIKEVPAGLLTDVQVEYAFDNLPVQYVTFTLTYREIPAYGDFCKPVSGD